MSDSGRRHVSAFDLSKYHTPYQWPPDDRYFRVSRFAPFVRSRTPSPPPSGGDPPAIEANAAEAQAVVVELADAQAAEGRDPTPGLEQREVHHDGDVAEPEPTEAELAMADQLEPQVVVAEVPARPQPAIDGEPMVLDEPLALEAELDQDDPMLRDPTPPVPDAGPSVSRHSAPPQSSDQSRVGSSEPEGPRDRLRRFDALPSFKTMKVSPYNVDWKYRWSRRKGTHAVDAPEFDWDPKVGDLYIHVYPEGTQTWTWCRIARGVTGWMRVSALDSHPEEEGYVLGEKDSLLPTWVTIKTGRTYASTERRNARLASVQP